MAGPEVAAPDSPPAPRRRGRPPGSRDAKPRKRRADSVAGQLQAAAGEPQEVPGASAPTPRPARTRSRPVPPTTVIVTPPLPPPPSITFTPAGGEGGDGQQSLPLNDLARKARADADWKEAQARKLELDLAVRAGSLIPREEHEEALAERASMLKRSLLAIPDRVSDELALETDGRRIRLRLRAEIEALIRTYSGQNEEDLA